MLAWTGDFDPAIGGHGTLTASNVVGQGVINGRRPDVRRRARPGPHLSGRGHRRGPEGQGRPDGRHLLRVRLLDPVRLLPDQRATGSTSSRTRTATATPTTTASTRPARRRPSGARPSACRTTSVHSTGNGAPGYGTTTPPQPFTGIAVGASTQFGGTGWDSIKNASQITDNDVIPWSDRGPAATGAGGVDVLGDGAFSPGDVDPQRRSSTGRSPGRPGAARAARRRSSWAPPRSSTRPSGSSGRSRTASPSRPGRSSSRPRSTSATTRTPRAPARSRRARRSRPRSASGSWSRPDEWRPGDYRGDEFAAFPHLLAGRRERQPDVRPRRPGHATRSPTGILKRVDSTTFSWTSKNVSQGEPDHVQRARLPDRPDEQVKAAQGRRPDDHPGDLPARRVRPERRLRQRPALDAATPTTGPTSTTTAGCGRTRTTTASSTTPTRPQTNIDGDPLLDFKHSEIQKGEYVRFTYLRTVNDALQVMVRDPAKRMSSGLFLGLAHPERSLTIPVTHFKFRIDFYKNVDWSWLSTPKIAKGSFTAKFHVPTGTPAGMYQGAIVVSRNGHDERRPGRRHRPGQGHPGRRRLDHRQPLVRRQARSPTPRRNLTYDNGSVFGANDWSWRAESGDWRFFYFDVPNAVPDGHAVPVRHDLGRHGPVHRSRHADLRPVREQLPAPPARARPTGRRTSSTRSAAAPNTNIGAGIWTLPDGDRRRRGGRRRPGLGRAPRDRPARHRLERRQVPRAVHDDRRDGDRSPRRGVDHLGRPTPARST